MPSRVRYSLSESETTAADSSPSFLRTPCGRLALIDFENHLPPWVPLIQSMWNPQFAHCRMMPSSNHHQRKSPEAKLRYNRATLSTVAILTCHASRGQQVCPYVPMTNALPHFQKLVKMDSHSLALGVFDLDLPGCRSELSRRRGSAPENCSTTAGKSPMCCWSMGCRLP